MEHSVGAVIGFFILAMFIWGITSGVFLFGFFLKKKILLWDDQWKETLKENGISMEEFADSLERTYEKIRSTFRLLGFFLFILFGLMILVLYLNLGVAKQVLTSSSVLDGLSLLGLIALSALLPTFINFGIASYVAETMSLKVNAFALADARTAAREKRAKLQLIEKTKQMRAQREAMKAAAARAEAAK